MSLTQVSVDHILDAQRREQEQRHEKHRLVAKALKERGINMNSTEMAQEDF